MQGGRSREGAQPKHEYHSLSLSGSAANGPDLVRQYDLVVEAADDLGQKSSINAVCVEGRPLVWSAVTRFEGQLESTPPAMPAARVCSLRFLNQARFLRLKELGVVGAAAGVMGCLEAIEALKLLLGVW